MRYFVHLAYDGTGYCGWQVQNNGDTVQGKLNFALSRLLSTTISTGGCGRTDSGVHATDFYAHFETGKELDEKFAFRLNSILPQDITIIHGSTQSVAPTSTICILRKTHFSATIVRRCRREIWTGKKYMRLRL
jgi:tRNA pseudouridine(38-40) synthase